MHPPPAPLVWSCLSLPGAHVVSLTDFPCSQLSTLIFVLFIIFINEGLEIQVAIFGSNFPSLSVALEPLVLVGCKSQDIWECLTFWPLSTITVTSGISSLIGTAGIFYCLEPRFLASCWDLLATEICWSILLVKDSLVEQGTLMGPSTTLTV